MADYELTERARGRVAAAAKRAHESLTRGTQSTVGIQTLLIRKPTFDEQLDGIDAIIISVMVDIKGVARASISYAQEAPRSEPAMQDFTELVADFLSDTPSILGINRALTAAANEYKTL